MPETTRQAVVQMADFAIERHLTGSFAQLDAGTSDVQARKQLYARFVERALTMASERLPDPDWWGQVIGRMAEGCSPTHGSAGTPSLPPQGH